MRSFTGFRQTPSSPTGCAVVSNYPLSAHSLKKVFNIGLLLGKRPSIRKFPNQQLLQIRPRRLTEVFQVRQHHIPVMLPVEGPILDVGRLVVSSFRNRRRNKQIRPPSLNQLPRLQPLKRRVVDGALFLHLVERDHVHQIQFGLAQ